MEGRERVLTALRCQQPDRVPYDITPYANGLGGFNREAARLFKERTGYDDPDKYFGVEKDIEWVSFKDTKLDLKERFLRYHKLPESLTYFETAISASGMITQGIYRTGTFTLNEWGTALIVGSDPSYDHFVAPYNIVNSKLIRDIEEYPLPDFTSDYRHKHLEEDIKRIRNKGLASVAGMAMTIFEVAWQIRGFNELLTDLITQEDLASCLLDRITKLRIFQAERFAEAGADVIHIGDDVGMQDRMMINPDFWRKWFKARLARIIESARKIKPDIFFFYHSDGYIEPIIQDLIEIGVNALNPVQPECMNPGKLKKLYGDKLAFWGTIGIQHTLVFGTPEEVELEVKSRIETVGKDGGLYLSPTHVLPPEVPYENIFAFVEAVKKFGKYK